MALLESIDLPLGSVMPDFTLPDPYANKYKRSDLCGIRGLLVVFTCNHCPYAVAVWPRLIKIADEAADLGIGTVAINPNINPDYPDDSPENMKKKISEMEIDFPYLIDASQDVARQYKAQCTPDIYLLDKESRLVYHGRIDDNWKDETQVKCHELMNAIVNMAEGKPISDKQYPSMGCSIKWIKQ